MANTFETAPGVLVGFDGDQTAQDFSSFATVVYDTAFIDTDNMYSTSTGEITIPAKYNGCAGIAHAYITTNLNTAAAGSFVQILHRSGGSTTNIGYTFPTNVTSAIRVGVSVLIPKMLTGDVVRTHLDAGTDTSITLVGSTNTTNGPWPGCYMGLIILPVIV